MIRALHSTIYFNSILIKWRAIADELARGVAFPANKLCQDEYDKAIEN